MIAASPVQLGAQTASDLKKAREEREKKGLALVEEIVNSAQSLNLPENRIRINVTLARLIWTRNEKRARALLKEAAQKLGEFRATEVETEQSRFGNARGIAQQLRQEILQAAAAYDPLLAIELIQATRSGVPGSQNFEAQIQMSLANQIAEKDPAQAAMLGADALKFGNDYQAVSLIYRLQTADKAAGERFLQSLLTHLRNDGFSSNSSASSVATTLVRSWFDNKSASAATTTNRTPPIELSGLNEATARELVGKLLTTVLGDQSRIYPGQSYAILEQMKPILPALEKMAPNQFPALQQRIEENNRFQASQRGIYSLTGEAVRSGNPDAMLELAKTSPPDVADMLLIQAARQATQNENETLAQQIIEKIGDPVQRRAAASNLNEQRFMRARSERRIADAIEFARRIERPEERAMLLTDLAMSAATDEEKATSLQLLNEAESIVGGRASNYGQLGAQLRIASAFQSIAVPKSESLVSAVIERANDLAAGALALSGFDLQAQYFREEEFVINISTPLGNVVQGASSLLGVIAKTDFEGAKSMAERFERSEMRLMALMGMAEALLSEPQEFQSFQGLSDLARPR